MKTITMTEFRQQPGERLLDVRRDGASFLLTSRGKPVALLLPVKPVPKLVDDETSITIIDSDGTIHGPRPVTLGVRLGSGY